MSTVAEIARLQTAVQERSSRWMPIVISLQGSEAMATEKFMGASVYKHPHTGNDARNKRRALLGAFNNSFVENMHAGRLVGYLFSGMGEGFDYFRMIFNQLHGGRQQTHFKPEYAPAPDLSAFHEVRNRFERITAEVNRNLEQLKRAIGSETNVMPTEHIRNAFAVMLLSPILYPPSAHPNADHFALSMEWQMWMYFMKYALVEVRLDIGRRRARMSDLVDLGPMFDRLKKILAQSAGGIKVPEQLSNLDKFRQNCEEGRISENGLSVEGLLELPLAVQFPPGVKKWLAAEGEGARGIAKRAQHYISTYDARI